jgi:hypothetical protein
VIKVVRDREETAKKENMYNIMCPEERLVLRRIIRVKGRMRCLNASIKGKSTERAIGLP